MQNGDSGEAGGILGLLVPRTMAGLLAGGALLAAAPLLAAAVWTGITLNELVSRGDAMIQNGVALERLGGGLRDQITGLERNVRQYAALEDPALLDVIRERLENAIETAERMQTLSYHEPMREDLERVLGGLVSAQDQWRDAARVEPDALETAISGFRELGEKAAETLAAGRAAVDRDAADLRQMTDTARWTIWFSSAALVVLAAVMSVLASIAVARPIKRLSLGIAALGHARYNQRIRIGYPLEMKRLGELLDWLRRKLSQLESDKNIFLRNVSHELKTPLATLGEGVGLLRDGSLGLLNPRQAEVAQILSDASHELNERVSGLLEYAAWRDARRLERRAWFDVQPMIEEVLASQKLPFERRQLTVELDLLAPRLYGQPTQWRVVLDNLLSNAIKHSPVGSSIVVRTAVINGHCQLSVRDRGPGVTGEDKARIFEPYVRGSKVASSGTPGTGVGLSVVKETVQAHGGTTEIEDANPGARFKLEWPCDHRLH